MPRSFSRYPPRSAGTIVPTFLLGFIPIPFVLLPPVWGILGSLFIALLWVNIFWGIINLMPVYPLDGGNVARYVLIQRDPRGGLRTSLWVSVITGATVAVVGLLFLQSIYMALLFGFLAFQSYQMLQSAGRW
ncbi:MAG: hypothetical protein HND47_20255 [Chloroflexi bacterium]|nr:hypothetical protein [Chloroflexota bacterium]